MIVFQGNKVIIAALECIYTLPAPMTNSVKKKKKKKPSYLKKPENVI